MKKFLFTSMVVAITQTVSAQSITLSPGNPISPTQGTLVYDSGLNQLKYWNGTAWIPLTGGGTLGWNLTGNDLYNTNAGNVGIGTVTPKAAFNIASGKTVLFGTDTSGAGNKLIWYPAKGAL